ncbi:MAG: hypothetical protein WC956_10875, partial [bacterium]
PAFPSGASRHAPSPTALGLATAYEGAQAMVAPDPKADLKELAREIGVLEYQSDEYDIPTFLRKQAD